MCYCRECSNQISKEARLKYKEYNKDRMFTENETTICVICNKEKHKSKFYRYNQEKSGVSSGCIECDLRNGNPNLEHERAEDRKCRDKLRNGILDSYGRICVCCGVTQDDMLCIDHIHGGGSRERKGTPSGITGTYRKIRDAGYPKDLYRILCWNCNSSHGRFGYCPHKPQEKNLDHRYFNGDIKAQTCRQKTKSQLLDIYGRECAICQESHIEFLTVDHIDGGGRRQMKELGIGSGTAFYRWLINNNFPEGYRILCFNCNGSLGKYWTKQYFKDKNRESEEVFLKQN